MHGIAGFPKQFLRAAARLVGAVYDTLQGTNKAVAAQSVLILKNSNLDLDHLSAEVLRDPTVDGKPVAMTLENTMALFEACY